MSAAVQNPCCAAHATEMNGVQSTAMPLSFLVWTALHTGVQLTQDVIKAITFALALELQHKLCSILFPRSFSSYSFLCFLKLSFFSLQHSQIDTNEYACVMEAKRWREWETESSVPRQQSVTIFSFPDSDQVCLTQTT